MIHTPNIILVNYLQQRRSEGILFGNFAQEFAAVKTVLLQRGLLVDCFDTIMNSFIYFQGVPGDGKLEKKDDLIQIAASIIFLSSVGHASANFNQYDEYAFPPNYPAILRGKQPTTKVYFLF